MKTIKFIFGALIYSLFIGIAFSGQLIRLDTSQLVNQPSIAVQSGYKPYCNSSGVIVGYYLPTESYYTYNGSGVLTTISELDGASGVSSTHTLNSTLTYSSGKLVSQSCPTL